MTTSNRIGFSPEVRTALAKAIRGCLEELGEDVSREGLLKTPDRFADALQHLLRGVSYDPNESLYRNYGFNGEGEGCNSVTLQDIPVRSVCEHHLLPFWGVAEITYLPSNRIAGIGAIADLVEGLSARPQLQERLTSEIATHLYRALDPISVSVSLSCQHACMSVRSNQIGAMLSTKSQRSRTAGTFDANSDMREGVSA